MTKTVTALSFALILSVTPAMAGDFKTSTDCISKVTTLSQMVAENKIPAALAKEQTSNATKMFQLCAANKLEAASALYSEIQTALKDAGIKTQ